MKSFYCGLFALIACPSLLAVDITTLDGRKYADVHDVLVRGNIVSFTTDTDIVKLKVSEVPPEIVSLYRSEQSSAVAESPQSAAAMYPGPTQAQVDHFQAAVLKGLRETHKNAPIGVKATSAYALADLEKAKTQAAAEGKLLGFIMVSDLFFTQVGVPQATGSGNALAHFYGVFHEAVVLVFVRHENELQLVPEAVKRGFSGPEEGGFAPNMAVTDAGAVDCICEVPYGGADSAGPIREKIFAVAANKMLIYLKSRVGH